MADDIHQKGFTWLTLDEASRVVLHERFPALYEHTFYDHVTLQTDTTLEAAVPLVGQRHHVTAYAHAFNKRVEAIRVTHDLPDTYGVPHITLSTDRNVPAFEAVSMLQGRHTEQPIDPPLKLAGVVTFQPC